MAKKLLTTILIGVSLLLIFTLPGFSQEEKMVQVALETIKHHLRVHRDTEVRFVEKKESLIPEFYALKFLIVSPAWEVPVIVYVDRSGEKVILGTLLVRGENVTRKEAGEPRTRRIDLGKLEIEKSPFRGAPNAKVTIIEFSNFECPYCVKSWVKIKEVIEKHPQEIKYVFKHFPFQPKGRTFELSEIAAGAQQIGSEAFWLVHDYLFSQEGQALIKAGTDEVKKKIDQLLKERHFEGPTFQAALESGRARKRVEEDMALGNRFQVSGTPTIFINGEMLRGPFTEEALERYLRK